MGKIATRDALVSAVESAGYDVRERAAATDAAPLSPPQQVDIPSGGGILHAQLYKPDGNGPFPVVIALHGCGGLGGDSEPVQPRYRDWAEAHPEVTTPGQVIRGGFRGGALWLDD